ncbi:hypothetical protein NE237_019767 [Protea cynaroides]|uniref:Uncharacterized protein n=1 Tax=Protea cynaroides TaxID=273540 RepID=A0A9Q0H4S4_9MAGN|nr:hypothetical protein NE237_019767 [Protea cynaroides]
MLALDSSCFASQKANHRIPKPNSSLKRSGKMNCRNKLRRIAKKREENQRRWKCEWDRERLELDLRLKEQLTDSVLEGSKVVTHEDVLKVSKDWSQLSLLRRCSWWGRRCDPCHPPTDVEYPWKSDKSGVEMARVWFLPAIMESMVEEVQQGSIESVRSGRERIPSGVAEAWSLMPMIFSTDGLSLVMADGSLTSAAGSLDLLLWTNRNGSMASDGSDQTQTIQQSETDACNAWIALAMASVASGQVSSHVNGAAGMELISHSQISSTLVAPMRFSDAEGL